MRGGLAAIALASIATLAAPVRAELCAKPDLLETYPEDGAAKVPTNARLVAHYGPTAEYLDEEVTLAHAGTEDPMPVTFDSSQGLLTLEPPEPLVPGDEYVVVWPRLRGVNSASKGLGAKVTFTAGEEPDLEPPTFGGLSSVDWDVSRNRDDCTGSQEERFRFDLTPGPASDDGERASLALVVFQTKGPHVSATGAPEPVLFQPLPEPGKSVRVDRAIADGDGDVCFAALVRDLTGKASGGAEKEICTKTVAPPFFYGCRTAPAGLHGGGSVVTFGVALLAFLRRRRHRPTP